MGKHPGEMTPCRSIESISFFFRQQWVRYFPWSIEANWLYIWIELDLILGFQFPQTTEKLRKFVG